jgi:NADH-quinone oxidoreductase subunit C
VASETLKFHFTPVGGPTGREQANPHAKASTEVVETVEALRERFGEAVYEVEVYAGEHTVFVKPESLIEVLRYVHDDLGFDYLSHLGALDRFTEDDRYEVFYNVCNLEAGKRLRLKVRADETNPEVPSATAVYRAAQWHEREAFDMMGVKFTGHSDLRRMFMPEDFEYYPQRKEFPLLGVPGSLPLPPNTPEGELNYDPFAAAHGNKPVKSYEEPGTTSDPDTL